MRFNGAGGLLLVLLLLLTSLVELVGHEHVPGGEHASAVCEIDHDRTHDGPTPSPGPHLTPSGERHEHQCVGCRLSGHRLAVTRPPVAPGPSLSAEVASTLRSLRRSPMAWPGHTVRGPPSA